jgi:NAD(P)-dependent dehydrogenase (short-subunit alcohol dehydrogenase family)
VTDDAALAAVVAGLDRLDGVVVAAGLNAPRRSWADQDLADFDRIVATNLTGPAHQVAAALPLLRASGGTVVLVSSYAAWTHSPGAGVAYSASKTALSALVRDLNAQEAGAGIRATHDVARAAMFVLASPPHVRIDELVLSPVSQRGGF